MKHRLFTIFLILALVLTMTACSAAGTVRALDAAEDKLENKLDAVEDTVENAVRKAVTPAPAATPSVPVAVPAEEAGITEEEARQIALDNAGFTADQVQRLRTEFEIDDGIRQYDVQFYEGDWEYEYEIEAQTGRILSFDKDHKYD